MLDYAEHGEIESMLARAYIADAVGDLAGRLIGRAAVWGAEGSGLAPAMPFVEEHRSPAFLAALGDQVAVHGTGPSHLSDDFELVAETFRRFADDRIRPVAEHIHRTNADIPEDVISGLAEIGGFGLSVPEEYGGFATGGESDYMGMVVATEELSRASLAAAGSLITRPEILAKALLAGGTEEQKQPWLPRIAAGRAHGGDHGDRAEHGHRRGGRGVPRRPHTTLDGGFMINGAKAWCTFAGRADDHRAAGAHRRRPQARRARAFAVHRGKSPTFPAHEFVATQPHGGKLEGKADRTPGYRGMHTYTLAFDRWFVPARTHSVARRRGRGFYLQMAGFENGRLQTGGRGGAHAARYEAGLT